MKTEKYYSICLYPFLPYFLVIHFSHVPTSVGNSLKHQYWLEMTQDECRFLHFSRGREFLEFTHQFAS